MFILWNLRLVLVFFFLLKGIWNLCSITDSHFPYLCSCFSVSLLHVFIKQFSGVLFVILDQMTGSTSWSPHVSNANTWKSICFSVLCSHGSGSCAKTWDTYPLFFFFKFLLLSLILLMWKLHVQVWSSACSLKNSRVHQEKDSFISGALNYEMFQKYIIIPHCILKFQFPGFNGPFQALWKWLSQWNRMHVCQ